ncbi:MAG: hypothetical protein K6E15_01575 [Prevotella sp.]|nr:hypothetical protein [Prevotella sp.]
MKRMIDYTKRPTVKPDEKVEGRLLKWKGTDYVAFEPVQKRDQDHPARTYLKETKNVSFYKNEGEKENSYSLHVNVDGSTPDAPTALLQKAAEALKPLLKKEPQIASNTLFIKDTDELKVWQRKKQKQLVIQFTLDTGRPFLMTSNMLRLAQEANKIINSNKF